MIHIVILAPDGEMVTRDLVEDPCPPNECPVPGCGGELLYMVRSSYFQYRRIDDDGRLNENYHNANDPIGETLETWLECRVCFAQPRHTLETRQTGTFLWQNTERPITEEYVSFAEGDAPCPHTP